jgi:hypothetical protein
MEFITAHDATVAATCVGVSPGQIQAIEAQYGMTLPANYIGFLHTMGESSGGMRLFGETRVHRFSTLAAQLPFTDSPTQRFFQVASESHPFAPAFEDVYLDLSRSDGNDAPLVRCERPAEPSDDSEEEPLSVTERIISEIFWRLDVARRKFAAKVLIFGGGISGDALRTKQDAVELLRGLGFAPGLPDLPRVACLTRDTVSLLISIDESLITFELGGDDKDATEAAVTELLSAVRGAVLGEPPAPRTEPVI